MVHALKLAGTLAMIGDDFRHRCKDWMRGSYYYDETMQTLPWAVARVDIIVQHMRVKFHRCPRRYLHARVLTGRVLRRWPP